MSKPDLNTDLELLRQVAANDKTAYRKLFDRYYKYLVVTVVNITGDSNLAKDLAQDVFFEIWRKRESLLVSSSVKSYLRRAVINKMLNHIKKNKRMELTEPEQQFENLGFNETPDKMMQVADLQLIINSAISSLPERCRLVFTLCRLEEMSHKEVAERLEISVKTVENQMTKALKILRFAILPHVTKSTLWLAFQFFW